MVINWLRLPPIKPKDSILGNVLSDIESHMPDGHPYKNPAKITWAHETTHGINSAIRNASQKPNYNGFYCLEDKCILIQEPPIKITDVASAVPNSLRGRIYGLYLVQQAGQWNNTPLYLCDEWIAYTNGSACGLDLKSLGLWNEGNAGYTIEQALEFNFYCLTLAALINSRCPMYDDVNFRAFLIWNFERVLYFTKIAKQYAEFNNNSDAQLNTFLNAQDCIELRAFARNYLGDVFNDYGTTSFL